MKYLILLALILVGCETTNTIESLCIVEGENCYIDKSKGQLTVLHEMKDWYCLDQTDLKSIMKKLNKCKNKQPGGSDPITTLCILQYPNCYITPQNYYDVDHLQGFYCMDETDLKEITDKLNQCN